MIEASVHVSGDYRALARRIRDAADRDLQREMAKAISSEARPAQDAVRRSVPEYMPRAGGYAALFQAALRLRTVKRASGVRITAEAAGKSKRRDVGSREKGSIRHPVWGRRLDPWAEQRIRPGFFSEPIRGHVDDIQRAIIDAVQRVANKIVG